MRRWCVFARGRRRALACAGRRRRVAVRPLRHPGRRVAPLRAGHARAAARPPRLARRRRSSASTLDWSEVEPRQGVVRLERLRPAARRPAQARGIEPLADALRHARPGRTAARPTNWAPTSGATFAAFARQAAQRYPFVHALADLERAEPAPLAAADVAGDLRQACCSTRRTPRSTGAPGRARRRRRHRAARGDRRRLARRLDRRHGRGARAPRRVRAQPVPAPTRPRRRSAAAATTATTITMATLAAPAARRCSSAFGTRTRIWLTEFGYQTNPPDQFLGVSQAKQALYVGEAALRAYLSAARRHARSSSSSRTSPSSARWQSGVLHRDGQAKPSLRGAAVPARAAVARPAGARRCGARCARRGRAALPPRAAPQRQLAHGRRHRPRPRARRLLHAHRAARAQARSFRVFSPVARTYSPIVTVT